MKIMGQDLVIYSIENPCISLTLFLHIFWASPKVIRKSWGSTVITSSSTASRDTLTLEVDPGVSEYQSEYLKLCQSAC
jgi:hypothetical protein